MATFELDVAELQAFSEELGAQLVEAGAEIARNEVIRQMEPGPPRTGETYPIRGTGATYQASAPGEPPAVREGRYVRSWETTPAVREGDVMRASALTELKTSEAGEDTEGGEHVLGDLLEHGTERMLPRPHVRPALEPARQQIAALVEELNQ
jgi:hypothetical protein